MRILNLATTAVYLNAVSGQIRLEPNMVSEEIHPNASMISMVNMLIGQFGNSIQVIVSEEERQRHYLDFKHISEANLPSDLVLTTYSKDETPAEGDVVVVDAKGTKYKYTAKNMSADGEGDGCNCETPKLEQKLAKVEADLKAEVQAHNGTKNKVTTLEGKVTTLEGEVKDLKSKVAELENKVNSLEELNTTIEELKSKVAALEAKA